jgi:hypothetical protein
MGGSGKSQRMKEYSASFSGSRIILLLFFVTSTDRLDPASSLTDASS